MTSLDGIDGWSVQTLLIWEGKTTRSNRMKFRLQHGALKNKRKMNHKRIFRQCIFAPLRNPRQYFRTPATQASRLSAFSSASGNAGNKSHKPSLQADNPCLSTWWCTMYNSIHIILMLLTNEKGASTYSVSIFQPKIKDCTVSGSLQHKLQQSCCLCLWCFPRFITSLLY